MYEVQPKDRASEGTSSWLAVLTSLTAFRPHVRLADFLEVVTMTTFLAFAEGSIQLVPDGTILVHIAFVLIMVAILNRVLFRPVAQVISEREGRNKANRKQAAELENRIEAGTRQYRETLREARASGYKLMEEMRNEGLRERAEKIDSLKREIDRRVSEEGAVIESQAESARRALDTTTLAANIRDQILKTSDSSHGVN